MPSSDSSVPAAPPITAPPITAPPITANVARREVGSIVVFAMIALALFVFARLASEVREGESFGFDRWLLLALRTPGDLNVMIGPRWLKGAVVDVTALGGQTVLTLVTVVATGYLVAARKYRTSLFLFAASVSGAMLGTSLKQWLGRPRPEIVPHLVEVTNLSFPSGHAMNSAVIYLTIALILTRTVAERRVRLYLRGLAIVMTATIGMSRVALGVHYPTDVLAGWLVGATWAVLCWTVALKLQQARQIEAVPSAAPAPAPTGSPPRAG